MRQCWLYVVCTTVAATCKALAEATSIAQLVSKELVLMLENQLLLLWTLSVISCRSVAVQLDRNWCGMQGLCSVF